MLRAVSIGGFCLSLPYADAVPEVEVGGATTVVEEEEGRTLHVPGAVMASSIKVTAAVSANRPPWHATPELAVADASAKTVPANLVLVPSVAELPSCQNTLQACAPLARTTDAPVAVVRMEPIWKTKTPLALFLPSRVSVPVSWAEEAKL